MANFVFFSSDLYSNPPIYRAPIYRVHRYNVPLCVPPISCFTIEHVLTFPRFTVRFCFPPRSTVNRGITVHNLDIFAAIEPNKALVFGHTFFGHYSAIFGAIIMKFFMEAQKTLKNPWYHAFYFDSFVPFWRKSGNCHHWGFESNQKVDLPVRPFRSTIVSKSWSKNCPHELRQSMCLYQLHSSVSFEWWFS